MRSRRQVEPEGIASEDLARRLVDQELVLAFAQEAKLDPARPQAGDLERDLGLRVEKMADDGPAVGGEDLPVVLDQSSPLRPGFDVVGPALDVQPRQRALGFGLEQAEAEALPRA